MSDRGALEVRRAGSEDKDSIAAIWHEGWGDGHLGNVPDALVAVRTEQSFSTRASDHIGDTVVAVVDGEIAGFVMVVADEVEQVYVARTHRGGHVADGLLNAAEQRVVHNGHAVAWLAVVPGNTRARRFYERNGWSDRGLVSYDAPDEAGPIPIPVHRYEKRLIQT